MNNRAYALMTGLFILALGAGLVLAALWLTGNRQETQPYVVTTTDSVYGLMPESSVYYRGIKVGKVRSIRFAKNNPRQIRIRIAIDRNVPIMQDAYASLKLQGVTGLSQLALEDQGESQQPLQTSAANPAEIPMHKSLFDKLSTQGNTLIQRVTSITESLNQLLNQDTQTHIKNIVAQADTLTRSMANLTDKLNSSADQLPAVSQKLDRNMDSFNQLLTNLNQLTQDAHQVAQRVESLTRNANSLTRSGAKVGQQVSQDTIPALNATLEQMRQASKSLSDLAESLRRNPRQFITGPSRPAPGPGETHY